MSVTVDYSGRTIDLFIFQGAKPLGDQLIAPGFGPDSGKVTSGIQKLVQKWAILFLTEIGSMEYHQDLGTRFLTLASRGGIRDVATARGEFQLGAQLVANTLNALETDSMPADERLASAELTAVSMDRTKGLLNMTVTITSDAGSAHDVLLPVPVPIQ
jgi:hypothetical protein